jgi:hypothetical protein
MLEEGGMRVPRLPTSQLTPKQRKDVVYTVQRLTFPADLDRTNCLLSHLTLPGWS